jgi:hypothetical protein
MKFLPSGVLGVEWIDLVQAGVSEDTLKSARKRGSSSWAWVDDPDDGRKVLAVYEKLKPLYKDMLIRKYGDVYAYTKYEPIRMLVQHDHKAESFYLDYRTDNGLVLPKEKVDEYTLKASWLNMINLVLSDKKALKKHLKVTITLFFENLFKLIESDKIGLPTTYKRLMIRLDEYMEKGYGVLVDWRTGKRLAAKVKDELCEAVLLEMIAHHNQHDDVYITHAYNYWAEQNNYKAITSQTVGIHRRKNKVMVVMQREGNMALSDKYLPQVKGFRPSFPLAMVEHDDNHLDYGYYEISTGNKYARYKAIVIIDSHNDYVLGYAYAINMSMQLIKAAYMNAMYHIRSLTGNWYAPHEIKSDNWGIKELMPYYQGIGNFIKTPVGSKHRGYLEPFFGSPHWKRCMKAVAPLNYTGNNITATNRGVNMEVLNKNVNARPVMSNDPMLDESRKQVEDFFHLLRTMKESNGVSRQEEWLQAWNATDESKKILLSDEQVLMKFGEVHNHNGKGIAITNRGVEPQIAGVKYSYDLPVQIMMLNIGKSVELMYDPYDMSRVLVLSEGIRCIATEARLHSRALADASTDSRHYLNMVLDDKRNMVAEIGKAKDRRKQVLSNANVDAETLLIHGITSKDLYHDATSEMQKVLTEGKEEKAVNVWELL